MYLMVRLETVMRKTGEILLGLEDMIQHLQAEGFDAVNSERTGWNIMLYDVKEDEVETIWKMAEDAGAYGYVPPENIT